MYSCFSHKAFRMLFSALLSLAIFLLWMTCLESVTVYADCQDPDSDCPAEEAMCQSHPNPLVEFDTIPDSPDDQGGKIKAVGQGKCYVYVYAQNGLYKKIRVKVN